MPYRVVLAALILATTVLAPHEAGAGATKAPPVDACLAIDIAFCKDGGVGGRISDLPGFMSGFVIYNEPAGEFSMVTLMVRGSLPDTVHSVFRCPGNVSGGVLGGGFSGCSLLGTFLT